MPPGKFLKFGSRKWHFLHFEDTFEQKSKGLKSHLVIYILTQIYFFIKIKAEVGKQAISIEIIVIVKIFLRPQHSAILDAAVQEATLSLPRSKDARER